LTVPDPATMTLNQYVLSPALPFTVNYYAVTPCTINYVLEDVLNNAITSSDPRIFLNTASLL